ncbi:MAG: bifunctional oligoribonuclease/PAP phosphatase NrnA [Christensenellaceae bacterium]|jgi:phosphoesterase RecJ-like protein|nr:bifunctional oligoribonuclease/PAP phosphatase NrnA [Christensenellaceae bacterium]
MNNDAMYEKFIEKLDAANTISVFMHINPDGDCVGSSLALTTYLTNMGKTAHCFLEPDYEIPQNLTFLPDITKFNEKSLKWYDLAIVVDCGDANRLGKVCYEKFLCSNDKLVIDHHFVNVPFTEDIILNPKASATTEILFKLFKFYNASYIDKAVATYLFTGLITDTGSFVYPNTNALTYEVAAELCKYGINNYEIVRNSISDFSFNSFKLKNRVLSKAIFMFDNKLALVSFTKEDYAETQTSHPDSKSVIGDVINIKEVMLAVFISATPNDSEFKISLRSKDYVNCSKVAQRFLGGGHFHASGCRIQTDSIETARTQLLKAIQETQCLVDL